MLALLVGCALDSLPISLFLPRQGQALAPIGANTAPLTSNLKKHRLQKVKAHIGECGLCTTGF